MLTAEQIAFRRTIVGASEVSSVLGINPWRSAAELWAEKFHGSTFAGNWRTRRGETMEPALVGYLRESLPNLSVFEDGGKTRTNPLYPAMAATCDARIFDNGEAVAVGEAKSADPGPWGREAWLDEETGEWSVPGHYLVQVQAQMTVTGLKRGYVVAEIVGEEQPIIVTVESEPELEGYVVEACAKFHRDHILTGIPPESKEYRSIAAVYPRPNRPLLLSATDEMTELAARYIHLGGEIRRHQAEQEVVKTRLSAVVGDNEGIHGGDWRLYWRLQKETVVESFVRKAHRRFDLQLVKPKLQTKRAA